MGTRNQQNVSSQEESRGFHKQVMGSEKLPESESHFVGAQPPQLGQRDGDQPRWDGELPRQEEGEAETIE